MPIFLFVHKVHRNVHGDSSSWRQHDIIMSSNFPHKHTKSWLRHKVVALCSCSCKTQEVNEMAELTLEEKILC
jgi:hypothetical protein